MAEFYVKRGDHEFGPYKSSRLKQHADDGRVLPSDLVRQGEEGKWYPASSVKGLFPKQSGTAQGASPRPTSIEASESVDSNPNLHACPDCGAMVSNRAVACPSCGAPVSEVVTPVAQSVDPAPPAIDDLMEENPEMKPCQDCGLMVPEQAVACPRCGIPFWVSERETPMPVSDQGEVANSGESTISQEKPKSTISEMSAILLPLGMVLFCFSIVVVVLARLGGPGRDDAVPSVFPEHLSQPSSGKGAGTSQAIGTDSPGSRPYSKPHLEKAFQDWLAHEDEYLAAYNRFKVSYSECASEGPSIAFLLKNNLDDMNCLSLMILFDEYLVVVAKACPEYDHKKRKWEEIAKDVVGRMKALPLLWIKNNRLNKSVLELNLPTLREMANDLDSIENLLPPTDDNDDFRKNWLNTMQDAVEKSGQ